MRPKMRYPLLAAFLLGAANASPLPKITQAWAKDADADGRIEAVYVRADGSLPAGPVQATVLLEVDVTVTLGQTGIRLDIPASLPGNVLRIPFNPPLEYGRTLVRKDYSSVMLAWANHDTLRCKSVEDSVQPRLRMAEWVQDAGKKSGEIRLVLSEYMNFPGTGEGARLWYRKAGAPAAQPFRAVPNYGFSSTGEETTIFVLTDSLPGIAVNDSVALPTTGSVTDKDGNPPVPLRWYPLDGSEPLAYRGPNALRSRTQVLRGPSINGSPWLDRGRALNGAALPDKRP